MENQNTTATKSENTPLTSEERTEMQKQFAARMEEVRARAKESQEAMSQGKGRLRLETPIESGAWYDYTLYLQPNYYTVPAGHTLELYVVPFCGFSNDSAFYDTLSEEELTELGFDHASMIPFVRNYSFTVDLSSLKVNLPVADKTEAAPEK